MTTKQAELNEAFTRLAKALSWLDGQKPDGRERANSIRHSLTVHMTNVCDGLAGKTAKCPEHPREYAHNCAIHRSERIGRAAWEYPDPATLEPNPISAEEERRLGEHES